MTVWGLGVFVAASTARNILRRPWPRRSSPQAAAAEGLKAGPRQVIARYPNHVWSVDRTRMMRWGIWPTWVLVAIDHFSRKVVAVCPLEGPNAGWVVEVLEGAFLRHGPPKYIISDQEGVFASDALRDLLHQWSVRQRFGAVGRHGSIAVTERAILTLKQEWLRRVPLIPGMDHLSQLLDDFSDYYNGWRGHSTIGGAVPSVIHCGAVWERPDRAAKTSPASSSNGLSQVSASQHSGWPPSLRPVSRGLDGHSRPRGSISWRGACARFLGLAPTSVSRWRWRSATSAAFPSQPSCGATPGWCRRSIRAETRMLVGPSPRRATGGSGMLRCWRLSGSGK